MGFALVAFLGACNPGGELLPPNPNLHCADATCESSVSLVAPISAAASDVTSLDVRVCRNQVCAVSQPAAATDGTGFHCDAFGLLSTRCTLQPTAGGLELRLAIFGPVTDFHDGDSYVVQVAARDSGALLLDVQKRISYAEQRPNGPDCEPLCRSGSL